MQIWKANWDLPRLHGLFPIFRRAASPTERRQIAFGLSQHHALAVTRPAWITPPQSIAPSICHSGFATDSSSRELGQQAGAPLAGPWRSPCSPALEAPLASTWSSPAPGAPPPPGGRHPLDLRRPLEHTAEEPRRAPRRSRGGSSPRYPSPHRGRRAPPALLPCANRRRGRWETTAAPAASSPPTPSSSARLPCTTNESEERGDVFIHLLSPPRHFASPICLVCWKLSSSLHRPARGPVRPSGEVDPLLKLACGLERADPKTRKGNRVANL
jgi:hypothetical protein